MFSNYYKDYLLLVVLSLFLFLSSCSNSGPRTVEEPWINFANTSVIDIDKVELTDSSTILTVKAIFIPIIATDTHLSADGKEYAMTKAEGIEPGKESRMPDSGKVEFKLYFEPLPFTTKTFDFIEGDEEGSFHLMDIDISGKKVAEYPDGIPEKFKNKVSEVPVPDPTFEIGKTTVNFHLIPNRPEIGSDFNVYINTMSLEQEVYPIKFDENGEATISFDQYGTAKASVVDNGNVYASLSLYPGETVDYYFDARLSAANAMAYNRGRYKGIYKKSLHTGKYSDFDRTIADESDDADYRLQLYNPDFADYHMSGTEYKNMIKERYEALSNSINNDVISKERKEYRLLQLQNDVLKAMAKHRGILKGITKR